MISRGIRTMTQIVEPARTIPFDMTTILGETVNTTAYKFVEIPNEEIPTIRQVFVYICIFNKFHLTPNFLNYV